MVGEEQTLTAHILLPDRLLKTTVSRAKVGAYFSMAAEKVGLPEIERFLVSQAAGRAVAVNEVVLTRSLDVGPGGDEEVDVVASSDEEEGDHDRVGGPSASSTDESTATEAKRNGGRAVGANGKKPEKSFQTIQDAEFLVQRQMFLDTIRDCRGGPPREEESSCEEGGAEKNPKNTHSSEDAGGDDSEDCPLCLGPLSGGVSLQSGQAPLSKLLVENNAELRKCLANLVHVKQDEETSTPGSVVDEIFSARQTVHDKICSHKFHAVCLFGEWNRARQQAQDHLSCPECAFTTDQFGVRVRKSGVACRMFGKESSPVDEAEASPRGSLMDEASSSVDGPICVEFFARPGEDKRQIILENTENFITVGDLKDALLENVPEKNFLRRDCVLVASCLACSSDSTTSLKPPSHTKTFTDDDPSFDLFTCCTLEQHGKSTRRLVFAFVPATVAAFEMTLDLRYRENTFFEKTSADTQKVSCMSNQSMLDTVLRKVAPKMIGGKLNRQSWPGAAHSIARGKSVHEWSTRVMGNRGPERRVSACVQVRKKNSANHGLIQSRSPRSSNTLQHSPPCDQTPIY